MSTIIKCASCGAKNRISKLDTGRAVCGKCKSTLPEPGFGCPVDLGDQNFDFLISNSQKPVLVDFWAAWCGPCKTMAPLLEQLAAGQSKLRVAKVDTERYKALSARFGIRSIPTLIVFQNGQEIKRIAGALSPHALKQQLTRLMQFINRQWQYCH